MKKNKFKNFLKKHGTMIIFVILTFTMLISLNLCIYSIALISNLVESQYTINTLFRQLMYHSNICILSFLGIITLLIKFNTDDLIKGLKNNENQKPNQ